MSFGRNAFSGFPFDNSRRSRDPLEDIAQRHPEFAQHLQGFPRRARRSSQDNDEFLRRRFERPFSSGRFERFGFPFDRDDFDREPQRYYEAYPEYFEDFQNQHPQSPQQQQSYTPQSPQSSQHYQPQNQNYSQQTSSESQQKQQQPYHSQVSQGTQTETDQTDDAGVQEQKAEGGQTRGRPIQQSNTCDLGQKQPVDEAVNDRSQRSMSAPPENKRFTSSINIPMGGQQGQENGAKPQSQSGSSGSTERVIPIHVEGRDDPVLPKNFSTTSSQPQPERIFTDSPRPQPERIFGQRPENFTQFVHRDPHRFQNDWPPHFDRSFPEEEFGFARSGSPSKFGGAKQPQHQQPTHVPPQYQQRQQESQQQQTEEQKPAQSEPAPQPKPQPPKQPLGPIEQIQAIQKDVSDLLKQVEVFSGEPKDKNYLYLDEMLTRNLIKLDNIDTQGQDTIRNARREAIKCIEKAISLLEAKATANVAGQQQKMEVDPSAEVQENAQAEPTGSQQENKMEVESSTSQEASKTGEGEKHEKSSKSDESLESTEKQTNENQEEVKQEAPTAEVQVNAELAPNQEVNQQESSEGQNTTGENQVKEGGASEGEKKEKKKTKKKPNKEDKEKKQ